MARALREEAGRGGVTVEYVLVGAVAWVGTSLLIVAGWALFRADHRAREARAWAIGADGRPLSPAASDALRVEDAPERQIA